MARILVVDDSPSVRELLRSLLTDRGYDVRTAADGPSGVASAREDPPDLVILDFSMPGMTGGEVLQELKKLSPALPVFFLTVYADFPDKTELDAADCCFVKSSDLTPMMESIARTLGSRREGPPCPDRLGGSRARTRHAEKQGS